MEGVTFQPAILKKSQQILDKRNARINEENVDEANQSSERFKDLYRDAQLRAMRKKRVEKLILDQECTFKPNLVSQQPTDSIDPSTQRLQTELTGNASI